VPHRDRFSLVGHAAMPFLDPLAEHELVTLLEPLAPLALRPGARTLDLGGGRADLSALLARRWGCQATSVDLSPAACEAGRERTRGLPVEIVVARADEHVARTQPRGLALASCVGATHAFGAGEQAFARAFEVLAPCAGHVLLADLVALGARAAKAFGSARADAVERLLAPHAVAHLRLGPERVAAYERAWCEALAAWLDAHPGDPREAWARQRIAWTDDAGMREARGELGFDAWVVRGAG
jgi:SAM-dependent methyltransferase